MPHTPEAPKPPPHIAAARTLVANLEATKSASQLLHTQATLLDALFAQLLDGSIRMKKHAMRDELIRHVEIPQVEMALRAQKQCRQTLDAIALRAADKKDNQTEQAENAG
jgi:hypothetical protein